MTKKFTSLWPSHQHHRRHLTQHPPTFKIVEKFKLKREKKKRRKKFYSKTHKLFPSSQFRSRSKMENFTMLFVTLTLSLSLTHFAACYFIYLPTIYLLLLISLKLVCEAKHTIIVYTKLIFDTFCNNFLFSVVDGGRQIVIYKKHLGFEMQIVCWRNKRSKERSWVKFIYIDEKKFIFKFLKVFLLPKIIFVEFFIAKIEGWKEKMQKINKCLWVFWMLQEDSNFFYFCIRNFNFNLALSL